MQLGIHEGLIKLWNRVPGQARPQMAGFGPCGWTLARAWGHPIRRGNRLLSPGVAGGEGLFRIGDGRRDGGHWLQNHGNFLANRVILAKIVIEHVAFVFLRAKKLKYVDNMTTAGVRVILLLSGPRLKYCSGEAAWERSE